jgi:hypothetical protein
VVFVIRGDGVYGGGVGRYRWDVSCLCPYSKRYSKVS